MLGPYTRTPHQLAEDYDLQQKIDLEIKMREGTTKLLAACKHPVQSLEASKSLLTSNERMNAYIAELQQRKASEKNGNFKNCCANVEASKARVSVSEIRIPLIWKDTDHFKNKGDYRRFAVFCLLKIGTEIYDTALMNYVDRSMTDVSFDDIVVFHHVPSDFKLKLEVYSKVIQDDLSIASTPRKIKKKISSSVSRTFGRKLAASLKDEFSEKLAVNPDCINEERISNYLRVSEKSDHHSPKEWPVYWASLKNFKLYLWKKRLADMMETKMQTPDIIIPINKNTTVKAIKPSVFNITSNDNKTYSLFVLNEHDLQLWTDHIKQHIEDYVSWKSAAENVMEIPSPTPSRTNMILRQRVPGSLYDETPLNGSTLKGSLKH
ncbi:Rhotekin-like protein [Dinothrombium tinctorium]|uniref:Rhotekin-like protein n=1 Tax=Dinothrombium tinctorium TaxID=1965070 RepID=A0A443RDT9_9ACAR|nr:Rhotekin-like protein [Dinothrombium tinctorium]